MTKRTQNALDRLLERIFDEIFEDYSRTAISWLDFEDYRKRAKKRMQKIVEKHSRRLATLLIDNHYSRYRPRPEEERKEEP